MGSVYRVRYMNLKVNFISSELAGAGARRQVVPDGSLQGCTSASSRSAFGFSTLIAGRAAT